MQLGLAGKVETKVSAKTNEHDAAIDKSGKKIKDFGDTTTKSLSGAEARFSAFSSNIIKGASAIGVAFGVLETINFLKNTATAGARYETLAVVMENVGKNAGYSAGEMHKYSEQIRNNGIQMDTSRETVTKLVQAHIDLKYAQQLSRIAQDAAVIGNVNSSHALERMVYGIQTAQIEVLKTIGLNVNFEGSYKKLAAQLGKSVAALTDDEKTQARLNETMARGADIVGTYEAAMTTAGKQLTSLPRYINDFMISMGQAFNPATAVGVASVTDALKNLIKEVERPESQKALKLWASNFAWWVDFGAKNVERVTRVVSGLTNVTVDVANTVSDFMGMRAEEVDRYLAHVIRVKAGAEAARKEYETRESGDSWMRTGVKWAGEFNDLIDPMIENLRRAKEAMPSKETLASFEKDMMKSFSSRPEQELLTLRKTLDAYRKEYPEKWQVIEETEKKIAELKEKIAAPQKKIDEDSKKKTEERTKALESLRQEYATLTISTGGYADMEKRLKDLQTNQWYAERVKILGKNNQELKDTVAQMRLKNQQEQSYINIRAAMDANYKNSMSSVYDDIDISAPKYDAEAFKGYQEKHKDLIEAHKRVTLNQYDFERYKAKKTYEDILSDWTMTQEDRVMAAEKYAAELKKITEDETKNFGKEWKDAFVGWGRDFSGTLNDILWGSDVTFKEIARSFAKMTTQMVLQKQVVEPFLSFDYGKGIKTVGSFLSSFFHDGGIVGGGDGFTGPVSAKTFAGARRFHSGLMPDEFPAILQRGEGVFTPAQMKALGGANKAPNVQIQVINNTGTEATAKETAPKWDGEKWVIGIVLEALQNNRGGFRNSFKGVLNG